MKAFAVILALTTAVMAAPTEVAARQNPPFFVQDSQACACTNAEGVAVPAGIFNYATCPHGDKLPDIGELSNFCFNTSAFGGDMDRIFSSQWCAYFPGYPNITCKPVKLCQAYPQCKNLKTTFSLCGHPREIHPVYCDEV